MELGSSPPYPLQKLTLLDPTGVAPPYSGLWDPQFLLTYYSARPTRQFRASVGKFKPRSGSENLTSTKTDPAVVDLIVGDIRTVKPTIGAYCWDETPNSQIVGTENRAYEQRLI